MWVKAYRQKGEDGLRDNYHPRYIEKNQVYSAETKIAAVQAYLSGGSSLRKIAEKYGLRSDHQLCSWIKVYNSGRDFKRKMSGGSRMKEGRETTQEERVAIAKECLEN